MALPLDCFMFKDHSLTYLEGIQEKLVPTAFKKVLLIK